MSLTYVCPVTWKQFEMFSLNFAEMYSAISGYAEVKNHNSDFTTFDMKISSYRTAQRNDKNNH